MAQPALPSVDTTAKEAIGTMWRWTRINGWSRARCPARGRPRTPWPWSGTLRRLTPGRLMGPITTDEYAPCRGAILGACGETVTSPRSGNRGRPRKSCKVPPADLTDATAPGDGGRPGRSRLASLGAVDASRHPSKEGLKVKFLSRCKIFVALSGRSARLTLVDQSS